jgi:acid stress-induced BolA-like protein IbaG/YrbA
VGELTELAEKVKRILTTEFSPAEVGVSTRDGVVVILVSERFEGMDDMDRQEKVWDALRKKTTSQERRSVSIVVALTPSEHVFHAAGPTS